MDIACRLARLRSARAVAARRYTRFMSVAATPRVQSSEELKWTFSSALAVGAIGAATAATASFGVTQCQDRKVTLGFKQDFPEGESKEVEVDGIKVLVHHYDGKFYCSSSACSHYGYPLKKGVQNKGEGNKGPFLVCPLHDATFDIKTGEAVRGPTVDAIPVYNVTIDKSGALTAHITSPAASAPKVAKRDPNNTSPGICIVGAGAAGSACADTLRLNGYTGPITVFTKEAIGFYDRTAVTKSIEKVLNPTKMRTRTDDELTARDIEVKTETEVTKIDAEQKIVTYKHKGGVEATVPYEKVLLASGGIPRTLFVHGSKAANIHTLRNLDDCKQILSKVKKGDKVLIVGGSFIGMEMASTLSKQEVDITMVAMESVPFERVLGKRVGGAFARLLEDHKIAWVGSNKVKLFRGGDRVTGVELDDGEVFPADLVLIGAGIIPQFSGEISPASGVPIAVDGSFCVDPLMRSRGKYADSFYIAGDCATFPSLQRGEDARIEHWDVAVEQGKIAAKNMLDKYVPFTQLPFFWTAVLGKNLRFVGHAPETFENTIIEGDLSKMEFVAYYTEGDTIVGVATVGKDPIAVCCAELMRLGLMPPAHELYMRKKNSADLLRILKEHTACKKKT